MANNPIPPDPVPLNYASATSPGNGMATASLVLGISGILANLGILAEQFWFDPGFGIALGIVGIVLGFQANRAKRSRRAKAGIVASSICLLLSVGIMVAAALPMLLGIRCIWVVTH